ncbi:MAG: hypothetical protein Q9227_006903 [Pyrenula ochraceoflavens]
MSDPLYELLLPTLNNGATSTSSAAQSTPLVSKYLSHLSTLSPDDLSNTEPASLSQANHSTLLSLQSLASKSHKNIITSTSHLKSFSESIPSIKQSSKDLRDAIPSLDEETLHFSTSYSRSNTENAVLDRRKQAMLLSRNADRLSDILELPSLLSTAISSAASNTSGTAGSGTANYSSALDLFAHIRRLQNLYPESPLVASVLAEAESAMKEMTSNLISSLRSQQTIRLAAAIRTIGWLRRVLPTLGRQTLSPITQTASDPQRPSTTLPLIPPTSAASTEESSFGALFLVCRLANLLSTLEALSPLRDLADQETARRVSEPTTPLPDSRRPSTLSSPGQQTERYLKRYIEIFREHSFATLSLFKNIFPHDPSSPSYTDGLLEIPSALSSFPMHLVELLMETLETYLPNVVDPQARESLLMQVLYAAGSLGRLGADFSLFIALLGDDISADKDEPAEHDAVSAGGESEQADKDDSNKMPPATRKKTQPLTTNGDPNAEPKSEDDNDNDTVQQPSQEAHGQSPHPQSPTEKKPPQPRNQNQEHNNDDADEHHQQIPEWAQVMKKHRIQASRLEALAKSGIGGGGGSTSSNLPSRGKT